MDCVERVGDHYSISSPHWKCDGCCSADPDVPGSFRAQVRALNIIWGNDIRYWQPVRFTDEETISIGFKQGLKLIQVNWIQVTAKVPTRLFCARKYEIWYVVKFEVDAFGWHSVPIKLKVRVDGEEEVVRSAMLESYRRKHGVWHEIRGGEFEISSENVGNVEFGMFETESEWWKGGMVLAGVKIRPISL